jgi:addiction module RelE/StbE family toxin
MMYRIKYLVTARHDRKTIKSYLNQYSLTAARRLFDKIKANMEYVKENPHMYETYERKPQFRRMVIEDYLLFYKVNENDKTVEVHHILHGMMNIEQNLLETE